MSTFIELTMRANELVMGNESIGESYYVEGQLGVSAVGPLNFELGCFTMGRK
jgi:hypothetical protein